ncbi:MAG: Eco57I restriction-modification methylase domain-containing protein, partial [Cytophagales bacterium]|nr:Eco57I restriction-modification methylase domain-containing protein [Cytophagales bacterium]
QIAGIELNEEAIRIAAFSLYLAVLHYQNPPDILKHIKKGKKLPYLIFNDKSGETHLNILLQSNAFNTERVSSVFPEKQFDAIVGNPPWGSADKKKEDGKSSIEWFSRFKKPTSDNEYSQMFLWLASDLLKENGVCGMLVSSGILLKNSDTSNVFKQSFLKSITLQEVANFIHTRHIFFKGADSPFLAIKFQNKKPSPASIIHYWTFRQTKQVENTEVVVLDKNDFKFFRYSDTYINDIWKTYYWGNQKDLSLINSLRINEILESYEEIKSINYRRKRRQGYIVGKKDENRIDSGWLKGYKAIKNEHFKSKYGSIDFSIPLTSIPDKVKETGQEENYYGLRLLIKDGIASKGHFISRLEEQTYAFRDTINCIRLESNKKEDYKIVLAILWSSLSRYFYFLTASRWGVWHDDILLNEILKLPIAFPEDDKLKNNIISIVDTLREGNFRADNTQSIQAKLYESTGTDSNLKTVSELEAELDEAIFELYNLTQSEIDLVKDRCKYDIDFFYNKSKSIAVQPIHKASLDISDFDNSDRINDIIEYETIIGAYIDTFKNLWKSELEDQNESLHCKVFTYYNSPMLALVFTPQNNKYFENNFEIDQVENSNALKSALTLLEESTNTKYSDKIYIEGIIRAKTKNYIFIIKRNQKRLWTKTEARIDAEATMLLPI